MTISQLLFLYHFIILFWVGNINLSNPYNYYVMNYEPLLTTEKTEAEWIKDFKFACPKLTLDAPLPTLTIPPPLGFCHLSSGNSISPVVQAKYHGVILDYLVSLTPNIWFHSQFSGLYLQNTVSIWSFAQDQLTMKCSFTGLSPSTGNNLQPP